MTWLAWLAAAIVLGSPGGWLLLEILNLRRQPTTEPEPEMVTKVHWVNVRLPGDVEDVEMLWSRMVWPDPQFDPVPWDYYLHHPDTTGDPR